MKFLSIFLSFFIFSALYATELVNEQFTSNITGWSVSNSSNVYHSDSYSGSMFIESQDRGWKTYSFGASHANETLVVAVQWCATSQWDTSGDYLRVQVNGSTVNSDYNSGGCQSTTFNANTNSSGNFQIEFSPRTNNSNEDAYIEGFIITDLQSPPIMRSISNQTISIGTAFSFDISSYVTLTDSDPVLSYALAGTLPAGLSFNTSTGIISGTPTEAIIANLSVTATDNDGVSNSVSFTLKPIEVGWEQVIYQTSEDTALTYGQISQMSMNITIDHAVNFPVSVSFATHAGTAIADSDYRTSSSTVTILAGQTSVTINMDIFYDEVIELTENFTVTLTNPTGSGGVILKQNYDVATVNIMEQTTAPMCYSDNFNTGTAVDNSWRVLANDGITPGYVNGRMRLTDLGTHQSSAITKDYMFPASGNIIITEFTYYSYAGNGADGIALVLYDSSIGASPWIGVTGGSLGYAQGSNVYTACQPHGCPGFQGGWLGLGLDEYGNYSNPNEGRTGTGANSGFYNDAATIRGKGDSASGYMSGYTYLAGTGTMSPSLDNPSPNTAPLPADKYRMTVDARDSAHLYISLERMIGGVGTYQTIITRFDAIASQGTSPEYVRLALTGSTGGSVNIHEIDDMTVWGRCTPYSENVDNPNPIGFDARESSISMADDNRSIMTKIVNKPFSLNIVSLDASGQLAPYTGINNNRVYLFAVDSAMCTLPEADRRAAIASKPRTSYVTFMQGDSAHVSNNLTETAASKDKKIMMNFINWNQEFIDASFNCSNSNTQAVLNGVPQCLNSNSKLAQVFPDLVTECLGGARPACESNSYAASGVPSPPYDNEFGCYQCLAGGAGAAVCSTDNFAIRPDRLSITKTTNLTEWSNLLRSGEDYNITINAYNYGTPNTNSPDYNVTNANSTFTATTTKYDLLGNDRTADMAGIVSFATSSFDIENGLSKKSGVVSNEVAGVTFDDVGKININIQDTTWSAVDNDDTPMTCNSDGTYICGDVNVTFIPDHFDFNELNITNNTGSSGTFTYIANEVSQMAVRIQTQIRALNKNNGVTQNFAPYPLWENSVSVIPTVVKSSYIYPDANETNIINATIGFGSGTDANGTKTILWDNADSSTYLRFNFQRDINLAVNPFDVNGSDLNISISSTYVDGANIAIITGDRNMTADGNATMIYGRTHAPRYRFAGNSGNASIYYEAYCNGAGCDKTILPNGSDSNTTDDPRWFINTNHTSTSGIAGNVSQKGGAASVTGTTATLATPSVTTLNYVDFATKGYPYKTTMQNTPDSWLIYNKYNPSATLNEFEVEFEGSGSWAGEHDTNTTTKTSGTDRTNRRTMW